MTSTPQMTTRAPSTSYESCNQHLQPFTRRSLPTGPTPVAGSHSTHKPCERGGKVSLRPRTRSPLEEAISTCSSSRYYSSTSRHSLRTVERHLGEPGALDHVLHLL